MIFQLWQGMNKKPEFEGFSSVQPAVQDNTRVKMPESVRSVVSQSPYLSITDLKSQNEYLIEYGKFRVKIHVPKFILGKDDLEQVKSLIGCKDLKKNDFAQTILPALSDFEKMYARVPEKGGQIFGVFPRSFKPLDLYIIPGGESGGEHVPEDGSKGAIKIEVQVFLSSPYYFRQVLMHEASHWLYDSQHKAPKNVAVSEAMAKIYKDFFEMREDKSISPDRLYRLSLSNSSRSMENDAAPMFAFFDESTYNQRNGGHPYDTPSELFASASAILATDFQGFFTNLAKFIDDYPAQVKKLLEVADAVVAVHQANLKQADTIFPPEYFILREKFG
ncbi:MAG TPA: hypothetical protein PLO51_02255, partial [Candidatus Micrarchaeota archaeon]|nr:hypothetical protein [Candidatus Micrarchaeota archaeon]